MNEKVLIHLNELFLLARPIVLGADFCVNNLTQSESLWPVLIACAKKYYPEMIRQEIISAAKKRELGKIVNPEFSFHDARNGGIPWETTAKIWKLARKEIEAIVEADNKRRTDEYENYRLACEQGVAIAPQ